VTHIERLKTQV